MLLKERLQTVPKRCSHPGVHIPATTLYCCRSVWEPNSQKQDGFIQRLPCQLYHKWQVPAEDMTRYRASSPIHCLNTLQLEYSNQMTHLPFLLLKQPARMMQRLHYILEPCCQGTEKETGWKIGKTKTNTGVSTVKMVEIEENMHVKVISASILLLWKSSYNTYSYQ